MLAFLAGVLVAALFIPAHNSANAGSGLTAVGGAAGVGGSGGSASSAGAASGVAGTSSGSSGGAAAGGGLSAAGGASGSTGSVVTGQGAAGTGPAAGGYSRSSGPGGTSETGAAGSSGKSSGKNSGASAQGVTGTSVKVGVLGGSSQTVGTACPRCNQGGEATDEAEVKGLIALWHKEGKLPVYGRDIEPVFADANDLDQTGASSQSACEQIGAQTPFASLTGIDAGGDDCLMTTYHSFVFDSGGGDTLNTQRQDYPYFWEVGSSVEQMLVAWVSWANKEGLLKGHVLGLYAPNDASDSGIQEVINATFVPELQKLGYHLAVDYAYNEEGQSDDPVAVEKMRAAGVNVVFIFNTLTEPSGFQNQAEQVGYHPAYPIADAGTYPFDDSLADVGYNADAENGNLGIGPRWWNWSVRSPPKAADNPAAQECVDAYQQETGTTLDVYNDDALIRYVLDECSDMQVILRGLENAGPDLTAQTFIHGLEQIQDMQTAEYESVSLTGGPLGTGANDWQLAEFNKSRWQPSNDYWKMTGPYQPWSAFPGDAATVAQAVKEGQ